MEVILATNSKPRTKMRRKVRVQDAQGSAKQSIRKMVTAQQKKRARHTSRCIPKVNDWKCAACGWWNIPYHSRCMGKVESGEDCLAEQKYNVAYRQEDDGQHLKHHESEFIGDWYCFFCNSWREARWQDCHGCGYSKHYTSCYEIRPGARKRERPQPVVSRRQLSCRPPG
jgi:hypothetical protein